MNSEPCRDAGLPEAGTMAPEEIARLPIKKYNGPVRVVASEQDLARALQAIHGEKVVGLDTETRPAFRKGQSYLPSLLQVAAASAVYLFQLRRMDFSSALAKILENEKLIKAGIGLDNDFMSLKKVFHFTPQNVVDLSRVAQARGFKQSGVRSLSAQLLGFRITKRLATSNWSNARLSPKQMVYAATDAWICRELFLRFQELSFLSPEGCPLLKVQAGALPANDVPTYAQDSARRA